MLTKFAGMVVQWLARRPRTVSETPVRFRTMLANDDTSRRNGYRPAGFYPLGGASGPCMIRRIRDAALLLFVAANCHHLFVAWARLYGARRDVARLRVTGSRTSITHGR